MEHKSTRERIIHAALALFSEKGYDGVGVDQIANAVGIKGPSLYNHFKGKEDILNSLIETYEGYYEHNFGRSDRNQCFPASTEELITETLCRLDFTIHDPEIRMLRKLFAIEQFRNLKITELTTRYHLIDIEDLYTAIFEHMMREGLLKEDDPRILAFEFTTPITMMIHLIDREPAREEEAIHRIKRHLEHFTEIYGK